MSDTIPANAERLYVSTRPVRKREAMTVRRFIERKIVTAHVVGQLVGMERFPEHPGFWRVVKYTVRGRTE